MSADMYTFHEAVSALQMAEEEVLDNHKALSEYMAHGQERSIQLLNMTCDVDYDQDGKYTFCTMLCYHSTMLLLFCQVFTGYIISLYMWFIVTGSDTALPTTTYKRTFYTGSIYLDPVVLPWFYYCWYSSLYEFWSFSAIVKLTCNIYGNIPFLWQCQIVIFYRRCKFNTADEPFIDGQYVQKAISSIKKPF